jgi:fumarate reductase flavoprotein subunit
MKQNFTDRRTFLKTAAAAGAGVTAASLLAACSPVQSSAGVKWDEETDVVVVGAGGTGLAAALEAVETSDAKVIIFEKAAAVGGSTSISGGVIQAAGTKFQKELAKVEGDTPAKHAEFWMAESEGIGDKDLITLLANEAPGAIDWMVAHDVNYVDVYGVSRVPNVDPALNVKRIHVPGGKGTKAQAGTGAFHIAALNKIAEAKGIAIRTNTEVTALIVDADKTVVGVKILADGKEKTIHAKRGVVLASGGVDHNKEMAKALAGQQYWELETGVCYCAQTNTGDGIRMGMALGADLAGMGGTIGVPAIAMGAAALNQEIEAVAGVWVNKYGNRFVDEASHYAFAIRAVYQQEDHLAWAIFDETVRKLGGAAMGGIWGPWSDDLAKEMESGKVVKGETIEELAGKIGVNPKQLAATLQTWNDDMANGGVDSVFGKTEALTPINTGPFYATKVTSVNLGTVGGLRIDQNAQVVDVTGKPIPHLYAGGANAGGYIGPYYPGSGTSVAATVVFGRIAGRNAAKKA